MKVRADEVQPGQYVRLSGDGHIDRVGSIEPGETLDRVHFILGSGGRGFYSFRNEELVDVGECKVATRLLFDLAELGLSFVGPEDAQGYIEGSVTVHGEHVRSRFRIQQQEVLTFTTDWADL